jgi:hypothetical protein
MPQGEDGGSRERERATEGKSKVSIRRGDKTICQDPMKIKPGSERVRRDEVSGQLENGGANLNSSKGSRKSTKGQEIIGCEPRIIERDILSDECPKYSPVKKDNSLAPA